MKSSFYAALILFLAINVNGQEIRVPDSKITAVTVFLNKAQVTRVVKTRVDTGKPSIIVTGLTSALDKESIQVSGKGNLTILGISHQQNFLNEFNVPAGLKLMKDSLEMLQGSLMAEQSQREILNKEEQLLLSNQKIGGTEQNLSAAELKSMADFFRQRMSDIIMQRMKHDARIRKINERIVKVQQQIREKNELYTRNTSEIVINVSAESTTSAEFEISYVVAHAGWAPVYDLRATDTKKPVQLNYKANVFQRTGEDWKNVRLVLSTANPTLGGAKPELNPWYLAIYNPAAERSMRGRVKGVAAAAPAQHAPSNSDGDFERLEEVATVAEYTSTVQTSVNTEFKIGIPYSISSGSKPTLVDIGVHSLKADYIYSVVPKLDADAFLMARLTGWEEYNLLPGEANVFFEGTFVAKTYINPEEIKDTLAVSLGRDQRVVVQREKLKDYTSRKVISSSLRETHAYSISVRNTKGEALTILVEDQVPVSQTSEVEVTLAEGSQARYTAYDGKLRWELKVSPQETKKVSWRFEVKYPKDKTLSGL